MFSTSHNILTNYDCYYYILVMYNVRPLGLLSSCPLCFFHTHASLLFVFVCFCILFHFCCSHARVFGKTFVHEFPISYCHTEWFLLFSRNDLIEMVVEKLTIIIILLCILGFFISCPRFHFASFHFHFYDSLSSFLCHKLNGHSCCSHAQCCENTHA